MICINIENSTVIFIFYYYKRLSLKLSLECFRFIIDINVIFINV